MHVDDNAMTKSVDGQTLRQTDADDRNTPWAKRAEG